MAQPAFLAFAGRRVAALGQGTWRMGEDANRREAEVRALRHGVAQGLAVIDTAEMYGDGATEELVGEAVAGLRDEVLLVSKVYPHNAGGSALPRACENSLRRLKTDRLDLYLLHWRGRVPLADTVGGLQALQAQGKILHWGVSNFDRDDMEALQRIVGERPGCASNQVLFNLLRRGPEFDLLPWMRRRDMPLMAYSPLEQGRLRHPGLTRLAAGLGVAPLQLALAWALHRPGVLAIPKAGTAAHVDANVAAWKLSIPEDVVRELDQLFPGPTAKVPLEML